MDKSRGFIASFGKILFSLDFALLLAPKPRLRYLAPFNQFGQR
jgi:hypothetical protein